jgi:NhaP-type Na+/H+ and K+/H+ antiporter
VSTSDLAIVAALVFAWGTLSARLERFDVTAPITFVVAGLLLTHGPLAVLSAAPSNKPIKELAEFTLALVLFSDASRVKLHELRADAALYLRLLGVALPLTIGLGTLLALALASNASIWLALLVGAALAPTDAALGAGMMTNPAVPARIRRLINIESGLNDGIVSIRYTHSGRWYVTGADPDIGEDRTFRLDRIADARTLPGSFEPPAACPRVSPGRTRAIWEAGRALRHRTGAAVRCR